MKAVVFPGQGSQRKGMGGELFARFPQLVSTANSVLGYDIVDLCLQDPRGELNFTAFTQPAIYVVSVLCYQDMLTKMEPPDFLAGHSIGEYAALVAGGVFDFETGLRIVRKRAQLMAQIEGGGLAAVLGLSLQEVKQRIGESGLDGIEVANINSPSQIVIGGRKEELEQFVAFGSGQEGRIVPLRVSGPFHTSHMNSAREEFRDVLSRFAFKEPSIPVISNLTAQPHDVQEIAENLSRHLASSVLWVNCVERLMEAGVDEFVEIGTAPILSPMIAEIRSGSQVLSRRVADLSTTKDLAFCSVFDCTRPLVAGALGNGASGVELVTTLARAGLLAFLDTEDLELSAIDQALSQLSADRELQGRFGVGLTYNPESEDIEERLIDMLLRYSVRCVEIRGYAQLSPGLLRYRAQGCDLDGSGRSCNRIIARIAEISAAAAFLRVPEYTAASGSDFLRKLPAVDALCIDTQAWRSHRCPSADLFDKALALRDEFSDRNPQSPRVFVGASGLATSTAAVQKLLAKGGDFAVAGSVFLLARQARLDPSAKQALCTCVQNNFREIPDWWFPECASASLSYVEHDDVAQQAVALQAIYLDESISVSALENTMARYVDARRQLLPVDFLANCKGSNTFELRCRLRKAMRSSLFPKAIICDTPLDEFRAWLDTQEMFSSEPIDALNLADILYPVNGVS